MWVYEKKLEYPVKIKIQIQNWQSILFPSTAVLTENLPLL